MVASFLLATREGPEVRERLQRVSIAVYLVAFGLYRPLRRPVRAGVLWSSKLREEAVTVCVLLLKSRSPPLLNALAGCGRHCAVLFASEHHSICSPHTAILDESALCRLCNLDCATDYHFLFLASSFTDQVLVRRVLLWCWIETVSYKARNILVYAHG